jgi:secreted trypsin-like serine protease
VCVCRQFTHVSKIASAGSSIVHKKQNSAYDSGSPIILPGKSASEDILIGLVSWGEDCADDVFPAVNARVSDAYDWIRANVCIISRDPPDYLCKAMAEGEEQVANTNTNAASTTSWNSSATGAWLLLAMLAVAFAAVTCRTLQQDSDQPPRRYISFSKLSPGCTPETATLSARSMHHRQSSYDSVGVSMH